MRCASGDGIPLARPCPGPICSGVRTGRSATHTRAGACRDSGPACRDQLLFERYRDPSDPVDRAALVERFLPLARGLAARFAGGSEPYEDLLQVASVGLIMAIDRFDPSRRVAFSSFATPTIAGELKRYFRDRTWAVRVPRDLQELARRVDRLREQLTAQHGHAPTPRELADAAHTSEEHVLEALQAINAYAADSLDFVAGPDDGADAYVGRLGCDERGYDRAEQRALLADWLRFLTVREREVLELRFEEDLTQREIGQRLGVSQMQVSRILRRALGKLAQHAQEPPATASATCRGRVAAGH